MFFLIIFILFILLTFHYCNSIFDVLLTFLIVSAAFILFTGWSMEEFLHNLITFIEPISILFKNL
jgi:hypothetical protein